jgi:hypothetical protein
VATATEVSTIGIVYTIVIGLLLYRQFDWSRIVPMLVETASLSGAILLILGAATSMAWALTQSGFSQQLANATTGLPVRMVPPTSSGLTRGSRQIPPFAAIPGSSPGMKRSKGLYADLQGGWHYCLRMLCAAMPSIASTSAE